MSKSSHSQEQRHSQSRSYANLTFPDWSVYCLLSYGLGTGGLLRRLNLVAIQAGVWLW